MKNITSAKFIKAIKMLLTIIILSQVACNNISEKKLKNNTLNETNDFKSNVIEKSVNQDKLFLDFWTGMSIDEYEVIKNNLIETSVLKEVKSENVILNSPIFEFHTGKERPTKATIIPNFINNSLNSILLDFNTYDTRLLFTSIKYFPEKKLSSFDKDGIINLYKNKYESHTFSKLPDEEKLPIIVGTARLVTPSYFYENYLFKDLENQKYVDIKIGTGEMYSDTEILGQFSFFCSITYISTDNYQKQKEEEEKQKQDKIQEEKNMLNKTKENI